VKSARVAALTCVAHSRSPRGQPPRRQAWFTDRDRRILAFCAEHRFVLAAQVALLEGIGLDLARRRLSALTQAGYLTSEQRYVAEPRAYTVTRYGRDVVGSDLSQPRKLDPNLYAHDVGVTWLTAAAHRGLFGELSQVVSERRMRSEDGRDNPGREPHGVRYIGGGGGGWNAGGRRLHYPDLTVVTASGQRVAFELELNLKGQARRERILLAYAGDPRFDGVVYLVATQRDRRTLEASARRAGLENRLYVQLFRWSGDREPGMPVTAGRLTASRTPTRPSSQAPRGVRSQLASRAQSPSAATRTSETDPVSR
jgi:hypothetical protein